MCVCVCVWSDACLDFFSRPGWDDRSSSGDTISQEELEAAMKAASV